MRELMLELLCYEPYNKLIPGEKEYIDEILSGNVNPPQTTLHTLFSGFYNCVQNKKFEDIGWLQKWKAAHGRAPLPLIFKKICLYLMVDEERRANEERRADEKRKAKEERNAKKKRSGSDFMEQIGLQVSRTRKWGLSAQFRRYAEADTYSTIKIFRNGVKKEYIVSTVKQLYYEAGRQVYDQAEADRQASESTTQSEKESTTLKEPPWFVKYSMKLNNLPQFVDIFAGSASVAASVVTEGCPPPIVNDYDPVMVCFAWAFVHCKSELRKRIADFHNYVIGQELKGLSYDANAYKSHHDPQNLLTTPEAWDDPENKWRLDFLGRSKDYIDSGKELAKFYQDFIMRIRSSYVDVVNVLALDDRDKDRRDRIRDELRCKINFNELSPRSITQIEEDVLDYALAKFYCCSFAGGKAGNVYHETYVNASSYSSYLKKLQVDLAAIKRASEEDKARELAKHPLEAPSSLILESEGHFSRYLRDAEFYSKDFRELLKITPSDAIYYWDSPYYLTTGYDVAFSDEDHKDMLDILRDAKFKWVFSMQYNLSCRYWCTTKAKRKKQPYIIRDYGDYYRGFCAPLPEVGDQRAYVVDDAQTGKAKDLYVILFDFDKVKKKWPNMKTETREMLVVNFNPLRTIPLNDSAVVYPFDLFLKCADEQQYYQGIEKDYQNIVKDNYQDIVKRAIAWRKDNIESKYTNKAPV